MTSLSVCLIFALASLSPNPSPQHSFKVFECSVSRPFNSTLPSHAAGVVAAAEARRAVLEKAARYIEGMENAREKRLDPGQLLALASGLFDMSIRIREDSGNGVNRAVAEVEARADVRTLESSLRALMSDRIFLDEAGSLRKKESDLLRQLKNSDHARFNETARELESMGYYEKAMEILRKHHGSDYEKEALSLAGKATATDPDSGFASYARGCIQLRLRNYATAVSDFSRALEQGLNSYWVYFNRGRANCEWRDYAAGFRDFDMAVSLAPESAISFYNRGIAHYELKEYEQAKVDFDTCIELDPAYADAYSNRAGAKIGLEDYTGVVEDANKAIALDQKIPMAYYNRGTAYIHLEQYEKSIRDFTRAIEMDQEFAPAYNNRGLALILSGAEKKGCADVEKACQLGLCDGWDSACGKGLCSEAPKTPAS